MTQAQNFQTSMNMIKTLIQHETLVPAIQTMIDNFNLWIVGDNSDFDFQAELKTFLDAFKDQSPMGPEMLSFALRDVFIYSFGYSIVKDGFAQRVSEFGPILEMAAGTGYISEVLRTHGIDVIATDTAPWETHYAVIDMDAETAAEAFPDRTWLVSWPGYQSSTWLNEILSNAPKGQTIILIGEGAGGCTGDDELFEILDTQFTEITQDEDYMLNWSWPGIHDTVTVWKK